MGDGTDFNDLGAVVGLDAVRDQIGKAVAPISAEVWPEMILPGQTPAPEIPASILPTWLGAMVGAMAESTQTPPDSPVPGVSFPR